MSFENFKINLKDVLQIVIYAVLGALAFSAQSAKIDKQSDKLDVFIETVKEIKADNKDGRAEDKLGMQQLINQVNTNSVNIKLLEQRMSQFEKKNK